MLYVLARDYRDFRRWCSDHGYNPRYADFVLGRGDIRGKRIHAGQLIKVPGYAANPWYDKDFYDALGHAVDEGPSSP